MLCYKLRSIYKSERRKVLANHPSINTYDIICITETWLTNDVLEGEFFLPQFRCFCANRKLVEGQTTSHGGTMICVNRAFMAERLNLGYEVSGSIVACTVFMGNKKFCWLRVFYTPPTASMSLHLWTCETYSISSRKSKQK